MALKARERLKNLTEFLWPSLVLALALFLAFTSSIAHRNGQFQAAVVLAALSLLLAVMVCATLVPKLLARLRWDILGQFQTFRFTRRGVFFLVLIVVVAVSTLNTGNNLLILVLSVLLASLIVSRIVSNLVLEGLKISLSLPEAIHAGQTAVFFLSLQNLKRWVPSFALILKSRRREAVDREDVDFFLQEKSFPYIRPQERLQLTMQCRFGKRGIYSIDGFEVRTSFPFGFFIRGKRIEAQGSIVIYPHLVDIRGLLLSHPQLLGIVERPRRGLGSNLYNIRDYQPGDSARYVHWKSLAKLSRLMVKDFSQEEEMPLNVFFSTYLPRGDSTAKDQFERAVSCIATLAQHYHRRGQRFRLDSGEFQATMSGRREDFERLMEYLSCVEPASRPPSFDERVEMPSVLFAAGETVALQQVPTIDYLTL